MIHGGWDGVSVCLEDGLWVFDTGSRIHILRYQRVCFALTLRLSSADSFTWLCPKTKGIPPAPRYGHDMQLVDDGRIMLFGGVSTKDGETPQVRAGWMFCVMC